MREPVVDARERTALFGAVFFVAWVISSRAGEGSGMGILPSRPAMAFATPSPPRFFCARRFWLASWKSVSIFARLRAFVFSGCTTGGSDGKGR